MLAKLHNGFDYVDFDAMVLHLVQRLCLVKQLFVSVVVLENVLEALRDLSVNEAVDFALLLSAQIAVVRRDVDGLRYLDVRLRLLLYLVWPGIDSPSIRCEEDLVVAYLFVNPLEGNDQFLGQAQVDSLQLFYACFVFGELATNFDGEVSDLEGDRLDLAEKNFDEALVVCQLLAVLLKLAGKRNSFE